MNIYDAMRLEALRAVRDQDSAYTLRHIYRWYSTTFHTPLHVVDELCPDEILRTYYEVQYEDMTEEERATELAELLKSPETKAAEAKLRDEERAESLAFARVVAAAEAKKLAEAEKPNKTSFGAVPPPETAPTFAGLSELPPDIKLNFGESANDVEALDTEGFFGD